MVDRLNPRARVALAAAAREIADLGRGVVGDVSTPMVPGERIRSARRIRMASLGVVDRAVLVELAEGRSWEEVGAALSMAPGEARRIYGDTFDTWVHR